MQQQSPADNDSPIVLVPVQTQNVTELIADQIRQRIFSGEFQAGEILPTEAELMRQTTLSRASVRSALRILQTQGLIQMRPGRLGGAIVRRPGEAELEATVNQLIRSHSIGLAELLDMQKAIEPQCAALAARNKTPDDAESLQTTLAKITNHAGDMASLLEAHSEWHIAVSRATHNELLTALMVSLVHWIHTATQETNVRARPVKPKAYIEITDAVLRGDSISAHDLMYVHVVSRAKTMTAKTESV